MRYVYTFFGGRSMTAFFVIFIVGAVLAFANKLTSQYVYLAGTLHGFVIVRAVSEDKYCNGGQCGMAAQPDAAKDGK
jgi:hypothetical protein